MSAGGTVRVGVIGTGIGARVVAPAFDVTDGCTVVELVSPRDDAAVTALCARRDLDLVSVHSPPFMHLDHVRRAVECGHAVLCDKPFGVNAVEAEEMCTLAREAGIVNLVNYEFRYHPVRNRLHALVGDGLVGVVEQVQWTAFASIWRTVSRNFGWVFDASLGGGWVRAYASHGIDFLRWTFGGIVDASAGLRTTVTERPDADGRMHRCTGEDGFTAQMRTETGAWITMDSTATAAVDRPVRVTVVGSDGVLEMLGDDVHEVGGRILLHTADGTSELFRAAPWDAHHYTEMLPWLTLVRDAVLAGSPSPGMATFADGLGCARVMDQLTGRRAPRGITPAPR
jgi:predicted dehydrogenase